MRTIILPAAYAPLVAHVLTHLAEVRVDGHQRLERLAALHPDDDTYQALARSLVGDEQLDRSRAGDLVITVASLPEDADVLAFPVPLKVAS